MLKVAHIVRRFSFDEWGGTENVVWNTVLAQNRSGIQAEILATSALSVPGEEIRDGIRIRRFRYRYPYFPMFRRDRLALDKKGGSPYVPELAKALANDGFGLIHVHSGGRIAQVSLRKARQNRIPCVFSLHGGFADVPKEEIQLMLAPTRHKFHYGGILDRITGLRQDPVANMDAIICIGRNEAAMLEKKYPGQRIVYLPNGIDCDKFLRNPDLPQPVRREWNIPEDRKLILCISRIDYQKNQKILVELLAQLVKREENAHLLLIGPVTAEWYRKEIVSLAESLGVNNRFTLIPGLPPENPRLTAALHEADVFILPSLHEPFGIVALEAWASGIPVIASSAGGLKDFIINGKNGMLFQPGDLEALLNAYTELDRNPELRRAVVERGRQDVRHYGWPALTEQLIQIYKDLIDEHK